MAKRSLGFAVGVSSSPVCPFRALQFGNQYIYQAMPRLLSLWLDFGAKVCECEKGGRFVFVGDNLNFTAG